MVSYVSAPGRTFSYTTGTGIEPGMCVYNGKYMRIEDAEKAGIEDGSRVEWRKTKEFQDSLEYLFRVFGEGPVRHVCVIENLDPDPVIAMLKDKANDT